MCVLSWLISLILVVVHPRYSLACCIIVGGGWESWGNGNDWNTYSRRGLPNIHTHVRPLWSQVFPDVNCFCFFPKKEKSHKLVGMRLEKHLDKIREQYQAQKNEEEERKTRYRDSPHIAHKEVDPNSNELTSSQTPEASPVPTQRGLPPTQQQGLGAREESPAPVAPTYPASGGLQHAPPPARSEAPPMAPPTQHPQPPPPFVESREISPALVNGTGKSGSPMDGDALFQYAWYHGSITREDATTRLDKFGGFDG